jgi:hypothetical protein
LWGAEGRPVYLDLDPDRPDQKPPVEWTGMSTTFWATQPLQASLQPRGRFGSGDSSSGHESIDSHYRLRVAEGELPASMWSNPEALRALEELRSATRRAGLTFESYDCRAIRPAAGSFVGHADLFLIPPPVRSLTPPRL